MQTVSIPAKVHHATSAAIHLVGLALSITALVLLVRQAVLSGTAWHTVSFAIFGASLILLYLASTVYHFTTHINRTARGWFRKIDHIMIYVLIAGTYTPICLVPLRSTWGWQLFIVIWTLAVAGITLKLFKPGLPRWITTLIYVGMGWLAILVVYPIYLSLPLAALMWLLAGGFFYSTGAIIYGSMRPNPFPRHFGFHEIWHLFVLGGSVCHFLAIYGYLVTIN